MSLQFHSDVKVVIDAGARGNSLAGSSPDAPGARNQYRVTTPKLPPPPPVCAHQRSRLGSFASRLARIVCTPPEAVTVTTSTPHRWSTTRPLRRTRQPQPPPATWPPMPTE